MGGVSGGERVCGCFEGRRPACTSVPAFASCNFCKRGDTRRGRRGRGGALAEPHGTTQHSLQRPKTRRRRLVQVAIVATRSRTASRGGHAPYSPPAGHRRRDVDVHLAFNHGWSRFWPTGFLRALVLLLFLVLFIIIIIISLNEELGQKNKRA